MRRKLIIIFLLFCMAAGWWIYNKYVEIYHPNVTLHGKNAIWFYIKTGSGFDEITNNLYEKGYVIDRASFEWVAEQKNLKNNIHPGRYLLKTDMNNNDLVNLLRSAGQAPLKLVINNVRTKEELSGKAGAFIEADSADIVNLLNDDNYMANYNIPPQLSLVMFIPNTYEFYWNTSAEDFVKRMNKEYNLFWTKSRKQKAEKTGLTLTEVSILASIVEQETAINDEKPAVAGVYINRLKKGMKLQADPTVVFAVGDFSINRVLNAHKETDSPYNTYKYSGLPPGPICLPSISGIDAVLDHEKHDYLFFCAKEDFSGYHNFAKTLQQHNVNALKFRAELNRRRIWH